MPSPPVLRLEDLGQIDDSVLNQQQLTRLRRIMDFEGNSAYLDERGIFNDEGMLYDEKVNKSILRRFGRIFPRCIQQTAFKCLNIIYIAQMFH